jgi:hypothetical protein
VNEIPRKKNELAIDSKIKKLKAATLPLDKN